MCLKQNQPYKVCQKSKGPVIKASRPLILQEKRRFWVVSQAYSLSPLSNLSPKHIQTPPNTFDSSLFTTITRQHSCTQSSSPWFHTLDLRFRGVDVTFQLQSTHFFYLQLFLAFSCSIICFIAFPSMFLLYSMFYVFSSMFPCLCHDLSL